MGQDGRVSATSILFVCLGNHCRSPAAHAVADAIANELGIEVAIDSAGTSNEHEGQLPHQLSIEAGRRRGYALTHRSRQIAKSDFDRFDLIIGMDRANIRNLERLGGNSVSAGQINLLRRWDPETSADGISKQPAIRIGNPESNKLDAEIDDPWGHGPTAYENMFDVIERSVRGLMNTWAAQ